MVGVGNDGGDTRHVIGLGEVYHPTSGECDGQRRNGYVGLLQETENQSIRGGSRRGGVWGGGTV